MRAHQRLFSFQPGSAMRPLAILAVTMAGVHAPVPGAYLAAQGSPGTFSLPEPTPSPTPTSAPQGPVDVREGVAIGPRVIPTERGSSTPASPPEPPSSTTQTSSPETSAPRIEPSPTLPATANAPQSSTPAQTRAPAGDPSVAQSRQSVPEGPAPGPSISTLPATSQAESPPVDTSIPTSPSADERDEDGWYDVGNIGRDRQSATQTGNGNTTGQISTANTNWNQILAFSGLGAVLVMLGAFTVIFWRRRKRSADRPSGLPATALAAGVRKTIAERGPVLPTQPVEPARIDLLLDIASASRSVMMFTVDYRLTICNRSDHAVRDLSLATQLLCARRGSAQNTDAESEQPLELIDRIGPQQTRMIAGQVQLPLGDIHAIRQGQKPLFIPMLHVALEGSGIRTTERNFVIGMPSATSQTRVHPIPLDTPPGGLPGLRAREVKAKTNTPEPA